MAEGRADLWYRAWFWFNMTWATLGFSMRTRGLDQVPAHGPVLLISNHQSYLDPILVGLAARRFLWYLARKSLFRHPVFAWMIRSVNGVAIDQEGVGIEGLRAVLQLLEQARGVVVFPEGHRTRTGAIQPLKPGIQLLLKRAQQVPVLPVGIAGAFGAWPPSQILPTFGPLFLPPGRGTIAVVIGPPLDNRHLAGLKREELLDYLFQAIRQVQAQAERLRRKESPSRQLPASLGPGGAQVNSQGREALDRADPPQIQAPEGRK
jgi:1-acyl-sn-glycerol-3-phosphate acyltransferase